MSISCLCYKIWHARNEAIWQRHVSTVDMIMKRIQHEVNTRITALYPVKAQISVWFRDLFHYLLVLFCFFLAIAFYFFHMKSELVQPLLEGGHKSSYLIFVFVFGFVWCNDIFQFPKVNK